MGQVLVENGRAGMLFAYASLALLVAEGRIGLSPRAVWRMLVLALVLLAVVLVLLVRDSVLS